MTEKITVLPDGSAFGVMEFELPEDHWIYEEKSNEPPMPMKTGIDNPKRKELEGMLRDAAKYAIRVSTNNGKEDYDPDAVVNNFIIGMIGYYTPTGDSEL